MAMRLTNAAASAAANGTGLRSYIAASPKLTFYVGNVNADAEAVPAGSVLATVTLASFGAAVNGAIASAGGNVAADDSGTVGCWALFKNDGTTKVADGDAGEDSGSDIVFDNAAFVAGGTVTVSGLTITIPPA